MRLLCFMYMLVSIASALVSVYACMLGCMYVCELGGSFAGGVVLCEFETFTLRKFKRIVAFKSCGTS